MNRLLILFPLCLMAFTDIGVITDREGIEIHKCHPGDVSLIEVTTQNSREERRSGYFTTTNGTIFLTDMSMIPTGTNIFRIRTLCSGSTSEVKAVRFVIRRPIPTPEVAKVDRFPVMPPMPPGANMPLPDATNLSYSEHRQRR